MKFSTISLLALSATAINARFIEAHEQDQIAINNVEPEKYLIELAPGETRWVTEDEKWELRRVRILFFIMSYKSSTNHITERSKLHGHHNNPKPRSPQILLKKRPQIPRQSSLPQRPQTPLQETR